MSAPEEGSGKGTRVPSRAHPEQRPVGPGEGEADLTPWKSCSIIGPEPLDLHLPSSAVCFTVYIFAFHSINGLKIIGSQKVANLQLSR